MYRRDVLKILGASTIAPRFVRAHSNVLYVNESDWNVNPNSTKSQPQIAAALESMKKSGGPGTIYFKPGTYILDQPLKIHSMLTILGQNVIFKLADSSKWSSVAVGDEGLFDVNINGITLDGAGVRNNGLLINKGWNRGSISMGVKNVTGYGARIFGGSGVRDLDINYFDVSNCSVGLQIRGDSERIVIQKMLIDNWLDRGLSIQGSASAAPSHITVKHLFANEPNSQAKSANVAVSYGYDVDHMNNNIRFEDINYNGKGHVGTTADLIVMHKTKNGLVLEPKLEWGNEYGVSLTRGNILCGVEGGHVYNVDGHCVQLSHRDEESHYCYVKDMLLRNPGGNLNTKNHVEGSLYCGAKIQWGSNNKISNNIIESDTHNMHYGAIISTAPKTSFYKNSISGGTLGRYAVLGVDTTTFEYFEDAGTLKHRFNST